MSALPQTTISDRTSRKIRKAFLLGAGLGTRLRPLTDRLPKPLVPFYHEPFIVSVLRRCRAAGIDDVMINTHHLPEKWEEAFPGGEWEGMKLGFSYEPVLLETGGGLKKVESWVDGEPVLVCNADILTDIPLEQVIQAHEGSESAATLVLRSGGHNCNVGFDPSSGKVTDMRHALGVTPGEYQFTGIYALSPAVLHCLPPGVPVSMVEAFLMLIPEGKVRGIVCDEGRWIDLGTPESYIEAHALVSGRKVHPLAEIDSSACLDEFTVVGPGAKIGPGAMLEKCVVWPGAVVSAGRRHAGEVILP